MVATKKTQTTTFCLRTQRLYMQKNPTTMPSSLCRHCSDVKFDHRSYAAVLVSGGELHTTIDALEQRIVPCVTAVCPKCEHVSVLSDGTTESLLCTLYMWQRLREWIDKE